MEAAELFAGSEAAFHELRERPRTSAAVGLVLAAWLSFLTAVFIASARTVPWPVFCFLFFAGGSALLALLVLKSAWLHVLAQGFGGHGRPSALFAMISRGLLPLHLFLPVALATRGRAPFLIFLFWVFSLLWMAKLGLRALRVNYGLSAARALVVAFAPVAGGLIVLSAALVFFLTIVALKLLSFLSHLP